MIEYLSFETGYLVNVLPRKNFLVHMLTDMVKGLFLNWHGHSQSSTEKALTSDLYIFYVQFYQAYPKIVNSLRSQSHDTDDKNIVNSLRSQSLMALDSIVLTGIMLSWTHYRTLMQVTDPNARVWYEKEAYEQTWSVSTLQRNISTQYYDRMLLSHNSKAVENEMKQLTFEYQGKLEFIRIR